MPLVTELKRYVEADGFFCEFKRSTQQVPSHPKLHGEMVSLKKKPKKNLITRYLNSLVLGLAS